MTTSNPDTDLNVSSSYKSSVAGVLGALVMVGWLAGCQSTPTPTQSPPASAMAAAIHADPARVVILRHAEKPTDESDPHLSAAGREHAVRWMQILSDPNGPLRGEKPVALFAPHPTLGHPSQRPMETLQPVAAALQLPIQTPFSSREVDRLARVIRGNFANQTVVICWVHEFLPDLARSLGVTTTPPAWKGKDFGQTWIIDYPAGQARLMSQYPESTRSSDQP